MLNCKEIEEELTALVDNETTVFRKLLLKFHLFQCNSCRKLVDIETKLKSLVHAKATSSSASEGLRKKIAENLKNTPN